MRPQAKAWPDPAAVRALIASEIMGWREVRWIEDHAGRTWLGGIAPTEGESLGEPGPRSTYTPVPNYPEDIAAAWGVVEKLQGLNYIIRLWSPNEYSWTAQVPAGEWECAVWKFVDKRTEQVVSPLEVPKRQYREITATGRAPDAAMAICLAALEALGVGASTAASDL